MKDTNNVVKEITVNTTGYLLWDGFVLTDTNMLAQQLGNYVSFTYFISQLAFHDIILDNFQKIRFKKH